MTFGRCEPYLADDNRGKQNSRGYVMRAKPSFFTILFLGVAINAHAFGSEKQAAQIEKLGKDYVAAQFSFNQEAISRLTAPNFVEVSPKGEVDERAAVIGFYAPEKRTTVPPYTVSDSKVRISGTSAVITQVVTMGVEPRTASLSQSLAAAKIGYKWLLISSQSTPLPHRSPEK